MTISIWLKDYQSFDNVGAGVDDMARINVIVGPNNAGKSKILKAIERTLVEHANALLTVGGGSYKIDIKRKVTEQELLNVFQRGTRLGGIPGGDHWDGFGKFASETKVVVQIAGNAPVQIVGVEPSYEGGPSYGINERELVGQKVMQSAASATAELSLPVRYISAERDVIPEQDSASDAIGPDGAGVTNAVRRALVSSSKSAEPVEKWMLADLNRVMHPDHNFSRIAIRHHEGQSKWEVYLEEDGKGFVPLSQCGSGLKTVLHLLSYTNILAQRRGGKIKSGTFLFEELENCLHPHIQRNLFGYLDEVLELPARAIITTHSSACLDYFQGHSDATLTHVFQEKGKTRSRRVEAFRDKCGVLDSMGTRASDALQSNSVIWVEGPSDRIFLKKWFELCDAKIRDGIDYCIMFYGGDLLSHLTLDASQELDELIRLLRINRNSAIVIDSDKTAEGEKIRDTKSRVKEEASREGKIAWITEGKEIENYVAPAFYEKHFASVIEIGNFDPPWEKIQGQKPSGSGRKIATKVEFASLVSRVATADDFHLDWRSRTMELIALVNKANGRQ